jgi:hypothetical protein
MLAASGKGMKNCNNERMNAKNMQELFNLLNGFRAQGSYIRNY